MIGNDAFQEADTVGITRPCTKHNYLVKRPGGPRPRDARGVPRRRAPAGPGPVVVDLPKNIQMAQGALPRARTPSSTAPTTRAPSPTPRGSSRRSSCWPAPSGRCSTSAAASINAGPKACAQLTELVRATGYPITLTLMGLGAFPASDPQFIGMLGMHGTYEANLAMHDCDVMVCIGARFDDRVTGRLDGFSPRSAEDPRRHRPVLDQQERRRRRGDRRRRREEPGRAGGRLAPALQHGQPREDRALVGADRQWREEGFLPLPPERPPRSSRRPRSAGSTRRPGTSTPTSPPTSASTRCGRRSTSRSTCRCAG